VWVVGHLDCLVSVSVLAVLPCHRSGVLVRLLTIAVGSFTAPLRRVRMQLVFFLCFLDALEFS
jgi:hypothetical protein